MMQAVHHPRPGSSGPQQALSPADSPLRKSPQRIYKPEHNDFVFLCLNAAIESAKIIESQLKKYEADLAELAETLASTRAALVGFVTAPVHDPYFDLTIEGLKQVLLRISNALHMIADSGAALKTITLIELYRDDFLLKQRLDQFQAIWKDKMDASTGIQDIQGRLWWTSHCGPLSFVPWTTFVSQMRQSQNDFPASDESVQKISEYLDFAQDGFISIYEFHIFLSWFGPLHGCWQRLLDPLNEGLMMGFMPAVEANHILSKRRPGTYLIRFSKTKPTAFAVTFVDGAGHVKHCLLHHVAPVGMTLKNPPDVYRSLREFVGAHSAKLKLPLGKEADANVATPPPRRDSLTLGTTPTPPNPLKGSLNREEDHMGPNDAAQLCVICMDRPVGAVFLECGHLACCVECSTPLKSCPICRGKITRIVHVFRP